MLMKGGGGGGNISGAGLKQWKLGNKEYFLKGLGYVALIVLGFAISLIRHERELCFEAMRKKSKMLKFV